MHILQHIRRSLAGLLFRPSVFFGTREFDRPRLVALTVFLVICSVALWIAGGRPTFVLGWTLIVAVISVLRFIVLLVLENERPALRDTILITAFSLLPLMICGLVIGFINAIHPPTDWSIRLKWFAFPALVAIVWEAVLAVTGLRVRIEQNLGRAVLTWMTVWCFAVGGAAFLIAGVVIR